MRVQKIALTTVQIPLGFTSCDFSAVQSFSPITLSSLRLPKRYASRISVTVVCNNAAITNSFGFASCDFSCYLAIFSPNHTLIHAIKFFSHIYNLNQVGEQCMELLRAKTILKKKMVIIIGQHLYIRNKI